MSVSTQTPVVLEQIEENLVKLTLSIEPARFEAALNHAYMKNRGKISLPGFRKGRAPRKMVEMQFGREVFYEDALDFVFPDAYEAALTEHNLDVVSAPEVDIEEHNGGALIFVEVHTKPHVEIDDATYAGINYVQPDMKITDAEIDAQIDREREQNARIHSVEDRPAENGDIAVIDFVGYTDGVPFPNGSAKNFELTLGSKSFIDTFEEQIVGKNVGDVFDVAVNFPEEYHAEDLAGKPAIFNVTLNEIKHKEIPEADDDFAQEVSEFDTLEEYKEEIRSRISEQREEAANNDIDNQLLKGLAERISPNIPQPMLDSETNRLMRDFANRVQSQGMHLGSYMQMMGMDANGLRAMYAEQANQNVLSRLALEAIAKKEGIEVSDEEYDEELTRLAEFHVIEKENLQESIGKDEVEAIKDDLRAKKALGLVRAAAVAVEKIDEIEEVNEEDKA